MCWVFKELREIGNKIAGCVCCLLCIGPVLAIVGIAILASTATDTRAAQIKSYNSAAAAWAATGYAQFAGQGFCLTGPGTAALTLAAVATQDAYGSDALGALNIPNRTVRYYATTASNAPFSASPLTAPPTATAALTLTLTASPGTASALQAPLFRTVATTISCSSSDSDSTCRGRCNGYWTRSQPTACTTYFALSAACLVVDATGPSPFALDVSGGQGCVPVTSGSAGFAGGTAGSSGTLGMFAFTTATSQFASSSFAGVPVTVRSAADPYVVLLRLTSGSGSLDLTVQAKAEIGSALLAIGIVLTASVCGAIYLLVRCNRSRNAAQVVSSVPAPGQPPQIAYAGEGKMYPPPHQGVAMYGGGGLPPMQQPQGMVMYGGGAPAMQQPQGMVMYGGGAQMQQQPVVVGYAMPQQPQAMGFVAQPMYPQQQQPGPYAQPQAYAPGYAAQQPGGYPQAGSYPQAGGYPQQGYPQKNY